MTEQTRTSRIPGFYKLTVDERVDLVAAWAGLSADEADILRTGGLSNELAANMIENVAGTFKLPLGIAANFLINGKEYLVPMAVEEPSVVAAASNSARQIRAGGGFTTSASDPIMIGQIQVLDVPDISAAETAIANAKHELMAVADQLPNSIKPFGGGCRDIITRHIADSAVGPMLIVHLHYDCRDAMGANAINTTLEYLAPRIADLTGGRTLLRILSNLADRRTVTAKCTVPKDALATKTMDGAQIAQRIAEANAFAVVDPYRAATHNKGIMNGIDPVCIATGNDWRAIEAGAHAYAARSGQYSALTDWHVDSQGDLYGEITLPAAIGIIGGATKVHPSAKVALKILGIQSASELAQVIASVGLAQNLGAIKALSTVGIQSGHMKLHARQVAIAAGAEGKQIQAIADQLVADNNVTVGRAAEILNG